MPYKVWAIGEETLATDFNDYVQEQVVATFPNAAARTAAIAAPNPGQVSWLNDTKRLEMWDGTAWVSITSTIGAPVWANFVAEPLTTGGATAGTVTLPTPPFPYRLDVQMTWRFFHPNAGASCVLRIPADHQGAAPASDSSGRIFAVNVEHYAAWQYQTPDRAAGLAATFVLTGFTDLAGGGIRAGRARVQIIPR